MADPLILTLALDAPSQDRLDALRRAHFPAHLNHIPAHVTLFHALPGQEEGPMARRLGEVAAGTQPFPVRVAALMPLGRGTALKAEAPAAVALRARLARGWEPWLTHQDRQGWRPHVTIQNKVAPAAARALQAELAPAFAPWEATATGLRLWRYRGGPWDAAGEFSFAGGS